MSACRLPLPTLLGMWPTARSLVSWLLWRQYEKIWAWELVLRAAIDWPLFLRCPWFWAQVFGEQLQDCFHLGRERRVRSTEFVVVFSYAHSAESC